MAIAIALISAFGTALAIFRAALRVGVRAHQRVDKCRQQFAQDIGVGGSESFTQQLRPVDIVGSGHRVDSFARVTLDGPSKNHAMTLIYPATTRRSSKHGPTRTPLWWTQPPSGETGMTCAPSQ